MIMETKYEAPQIVALGSLAELTLNNDFGYDPFDPFKHDSRS
jgi:hypothetical protein